MLVYGENSNAPIAGASQYKSAGRRKQSSIRVKAVKRTRRSKKRTTRKKKLSLKNKKFLKKLGFRLKR